MLDYHNFVLVKQSMNTYNSNLLLFNESIEYSKQLILKKNMEYTCVVFM